MAKSFFNQLGTKGKVTSVLALGSFVLQFISRPVIGNSSTYLFGVLGGFFCLLTIIFYYQSKKTDPGTSLF
ncbi:MAG: hypothetical protein V1704_02680 [Candidatus Vogelbacteria bacterium]